MPGSSVSVACDSEAGPVTINFYDAAVPGQTKAASTPDSCTKSEDGVYSNVTCTTTGTSTGEQGLKTGP
jgi:hypothetical protein